MCSEWSQEHEEETEGIGNQNENQNHTDYSIAEISLNTQKSPGDLRRCAVPQTQVKDQQLKLV